MFWEYILSNLPLVIILILAIIICGADLIKAIGVWKAKKQESIDKEVNIKKEKDALTETLLRLESKLGSIDKKLEDQDKRFDKVEERLEDLTQSDMHDIKSWIVDQYHKFYVEQKWIDAFSADTLDRRYDDYKKEGGNSYIETLMERLHTLPMDPPVRPVERDEEE
jgi:chromosome segregation ATPase